MKMLAMVMVILYYIVSSQAIHFQRPARQSSVQLRVTCPLSHLTLEMHYLWQDEGSNSYPKSAAQVCPRDLEEVQYHEISSESIHGSH